MQIWDQRKGMELEGELGTAYDRLASDERNDGVTEDIKSGSKSGIRGKERISVASLGRRMTVWLQRRGTME